MRSLCSPGALPSGYAAIDGGRSGERVQLGFLWRVRESGRARPVMAICHDKRGRLDAARDPRGGYKVDVSRGERIGRVSSEWFSRLADERYLSLSELFAAVHDRAERSRNADCRQVRRSIWKRAVRTLSGWR